MKTTIDVQLVSYAGYTPAEVEHGPGDRVEILRVDTAQQVLTVAIIRTPLHPGQME